MPHVWRDLARRLQQQSLLQELLQQHSIMDECVQTAALSLASTAEAADCLLGVWTLAMHIPDENKPSLSQLAAVGATNELLSAAAVIIAALWRSQPIKQQYNNALTTAAAAAVQGSSHRGSGHPGLQAACMHAAD